jgi:hypothetical protein
MPYQVTIASGKKDVLLPNGLRYKTGDVVTLADDHYALITPAAAAALFSATAHTGGGGSVSRTVTLKAPLKDVVLPNGIRYQGGAVVVLSDAQYSLMTATARTALFSADVVTP